MKKVRMIVAMCTILAIAASTAFAGTAYKSYSTTVGKLNGTGYTGFQTKSITEQNGRLHSQFVGGDYVVDACMQEGVDGNVGLWTRNVDDGKYYTLDSYILHETGDRVRVKFSNDVTTPVAVQVEGRWKSDYVN